MNDLLTQLMEKAELNETQLKILQLDKVGYTSEEIARELEIGINAVYARRSEAVRKLAHSAKLLAGDFTTDAAPVKE